MAAGRAPAAGRPARTGSQRARHQLIVTYHPAYLLRDPRPKKEAWADLQIAMKELGAETAGQKAEKRPGSLTVPISTQEIGGEGGTPFFRIVLFFVLTIPTEGQNPARGVLVQRFEESPDEAQTEGTLAWLACTRASRVNLIGTVIDDCFSMGLLT